MRITCKIWACMPAQILSGAFAGCEALRTEQPANVPEACDSQRCRGGEATSTMSRMRRFGCAAERSGAAYPTSLSIRLFGVSSSQQFNFALGVNKVIPWRNFHFLHVFFNELVCPVFHLLMQLTNKVKNFFNLSVRRLNRLCPKLTATIRTNCDTKFIRL